MQLFTFTTLNCNLIIEKNGKQMSVLTIKLLISGYAYLHMYQI